MKEFEEATREVDLYLTEPSLRDTSGRVCKRKHRNMLKNAISVKSLRPIFSSLEEFSTLFLAGGLLLSGTWTLWDFSPKQ